MDEFRINFNIFGKYSDFDSWQKAELSTLVKKRKREESSETAQSLDDRYRTGHRQCRQMLGPPSSGVGALKTGEKNDNKNK